MQDPCACWQCTRLYLKGATKSSDDPGAAGDLWRAEMRTARRHNGGNTPREESPANIPRLVRSNAMLSKLTFSELERGCWCSKRAEARQLLMNWRDVEAILAV